MIDEILDSYGRGGIRKRYGTGTAATIARVAQIALAGREIKLRPVDEREKAPAVLNRLIGLPTGLEPDPFGRLFAIDSRDPTPVTTR